MKWLVSGTWEKTGEPGTMTVKAASMREAFDDARFRGMLPIEAVQAGGQPSSTRVNPAQSTSTMKALAIGSTVAFVACCIFAIVVPMFSFFAMVTLVCAIIFIVAASLTRER